MIFGGTHPGTDRLPLQLEVRLEEINRAGTLTESQEAKLRLAGRGDIKRILDLIDAVREKAQAAKNEPERIGAMTTESQSLRTTLEGGAFGPGSLFEKTLHATLTRGQAAERREVENERRQYRHQARIDLVVGQIADQAGLTDDQRSRLAGVLQSRTSPPLKAGRMDIAALMCQMARIPEGTLRPIFDEAQWAVMRPYLDLSKRRDPSLVASGILPAIAEELPGEEQGEQAKD